MSSLATPEGEVPVVFIDAADFKRTVDLKELWARRELIFFLGLRDVTARYKQSKLGVGWAIAQPLSTMLTFWFFLGKIGHLQSDGIPYALFTYSGILLWTFFANAVSASGQSILSSSHLISKVYFPRMAIPISSIASGLVDVTISSLMLIPLLIYFRVPFGVSQLFAPLVILLTAVTAVSTGLFISAFTVRYRDVRHALPFLLQMGVYVSPIIYPLSKVPEKYRIFVFINPVAGLIETFRACVIHTPFHLAPLLMAIASTSIILFFSIRVFRQMEKEFADLA